MKVKLLGSLFVMAISFSTDNPAVHVIAVFVIATLVTELEFLEKLAALIWNRKEYWDYKITTAGASDIKEKITREVEAEILEALEIDDVESIGVVENEPEGLMEISQAVTKNIDKDDVIKATLTTEAEILMEFRRQLRGKKITLELRILSENSRSIIDAIVETPNVHYIVEAKSKKTKLILSKAVEQLDRYRKEYQQYLKERKIDVNIQTAILIPSSDDHLSEFRGIPVIQYDKPTNSFSNLSIFDKLSGSSYDSVDEMRLLAQLLENFFKEYPRWAFSPLRIKKWGSEQNDLKQLENYSTREIRSELDKMLDRGVLVSRQSKKGNKLFVAAPKS